MMGKSRISERKETVSYKVKPGDTLEKIARHQHTTVDTIKKLNDLPGDKIVVGQQLQVSDGDR